MLYVLVGLGFADVWDASRERPGSRSSLVVVAAGWPVVLVGLFLGMMALVLAEVGSGVVRTVRRIAGRR